MGNALRFLYNKCSDSQSLGHHGVSSQTVAVSALAQDLLHFEVTSQVPEELSKHVVSSKKAQANWYKKLLLEWKEAKPPPKTPEEATMLVIQTLFSNPRQPRTRATGSDSLSFHLQHVWGWVNSVHHCL